MLRIIACAVLVLGGAAAAAAQEPSTRELERINWMEFREVVPARSETVLVPLGTLEPHGVTANGADIIAPVAIARAIAPRVRAMIAPAIPYGMTGSMDAYPGAFTIPEEAYRAYVKAVLLGLARNKFRNIILVNGHGGPQTAVLNALGVEVAGAKPASARSWSTGGPTVPTSRWRCSARTAATPARTRTRSCWRSIRRSSTSSATPARR
jgi:hypothetical protein